jgi:hypothetical protein
MPVVVIIQDVRQCRTNGYGDLDMVFRKPPLIIILLFSAVLARR